MAARRWLPWGGKKSLGVGNPLRSAKNALTAAGFRLKGRDGDMMRRLLLPWQSRSFAYYDLIGEIKYSAQFYARMLSPLELLIEEKVTKNGKAEWVESENPDALAALDRIQDPGGGRTGLLGTYGRLMFLTGETYLFVTTDPETEEEQWEFLSTDELRPQGRSYLRFRAPSLPSEEYREPSEEDDFDPVDPETAVAYRIWQPHPRYSMYADATMQGVLDLCEELVLLTQSVRARARSRLAGSGILAISDEFSAVPLEPVPDEDLTEDPFVDDLVEAMMTAIANEGSASAVVPLVVRGPTDAVKDGIKHIQIIDPMQVYPETGLRYECIKRIAIGLDMPPEQLLGMTDANHWSVWMIDEQTWKAHGQPKAQQLVDDLTAAYLRPYLRESVGLVNWADFRIGYDASKIINHPDRTKDAKDLYDRRAIGKEALRRAANFDETDAPTKDELAEMVGVAVRDSSLAWFGTPAPRGGAVEVAPGVIDSDQPGVAGEVPGAGGGTTKPPTGKGTGADVEKGPPASGPPDADDKELIGSAIAEARIIGAVQMALYRAREAAGNRILSYARRTPDTLELLTGVRTSQVAATLGRELVAALKAPPPAELVSSAHDLIADALRLYEIRDGKAARLLAAQIEAHAADTLFEMEPRPLPLHFEQYVAAIVRRTP